MGREDCRAEGVMEWVRMRDWRDVIMVVARNVRRMHKQGGVYEKRNGGTGCGDRMEGG